MYWLTFSNLNFYPSFFKMSFCPNSCMHLKNSFQVRKTYLITYRSLNFTLWNCTLQHIRRLIRPFFIMSYCEMYYIYVSKFKKIYPVIKWKADVLFSNAVSFNFVFFLNIFPSFDTIHDTLSQSTRLKGFQRFSKT